jgi:hypothetical protein
LRATRKLIRAKLAFFRFALEQTARATVDETLRAEAQLH